MPSVPRIGFLTSCEERCGVADYSRTLLAALERELSGEMRVEVVPAPFGSHPPAHYAGLARLLRECDAAHVQFSYASFGGLHPLRSGWPAFARRLRGPAVVTVHELDLGAERRGLAAPLARAYLRRFNRGLAVHPAVRRFLVHAQPLAADLRALGAPPEAVLTRPLPVELPVGEAPDPAAARARLGVGDRPLLVILGFLARRKGYETALAALAALPAEWVLVAAGGEHAADRTRPAERLQAEAERLGVAGRLRITGYLDAAGLANVTAAATLVLAPFTSMSASASVNYALARGRAVIASDLPALRALGCTELVPPGDPQALAEAIRRLQENPEQRVELETAARGYAQRHSFARLAGETADLYREILKNPDRATDR